MFVKTLALALLLSSGITIARDVEVISVTTVNLEEMERKKAEIEKLLTDTTLREADHVALLKLRTDAAHVVELSQECGNVAPGNGPNPKCNAFYREQLPSFEANFGTITGNLYLNRLGLVKGLKDRVYQIEACVNAMSAFVNPTLLPQNLISPKVQRSLLEPLDETEAEFSMAFQVSVNNNRLQAAGELATRWIGSCGDVVRHPAEAKFAPYFLRKLKPFAQNYGFTVNTNDTMAAFHVPGKWTYRYQLNNQDLATGKVGGLIDDDANLLVFKYVGGVVSGEVMQGSLSVSDYSVKRVIPVSDENGVKVIWSVGRDTVIPKGAPAAPVVKSISMNEVLPAPVAAPVPTPVPVTIPVSAAVAGPTPAEPASRSVEVPAVATSTRPSAPVNVSSVPPTTPPAIVVEPAPVAVSMTASSTPAPPADPTASAPPVPVVVPPAPVPSASLTATSVAANVIPTPPPPAPKKAPEKKGSSVLASSLVITGVVLVGGGLATYMAMMDKPAKSEDANSAKPWEASIQW